MAEYYVAWSEKDNPECDMINKREPTWFRVFRGGWPNEAITPLLTKNEANEMLRKIKLLDPPAQKELDLWR
jgi:hypothetical protein